LEKTSKSASFQLAFTLLELLGAVVILGILAGIGFPLFVQFRDRAETVLCGSKLRGLYNGTAAYVHDNQAWPSILPSTRAEHSGGAGKEGAASFDARWVEALKPYGISEQDWYCPTQERARLRRGVAASSEKDPRPARIDYTPTLFQGGGMAPYQWPKHPWFIERGSPHGTGPQIILTNGAVVSIDEVIRNETGGQP
jgi:prepilin-type N-terminal cleavage/methylation domain-containing protein